MSRVYSRSDNACMPGIDRMLQGRDISSLVIVIAVWSVFGDDLFDGHASPLRDIQIADELVPLLESIFPAIHLRVSPSVLVNTWSRGNAA